MLGLAVETVAEVLEEGMTEIELSAEVERTMRRAGHQGTTRSRAFNQEMHYGAILAGPSAAAPGGIDAPIVGPGPNAAIGKGASPRPIRRNEPIVVDLVGAYEGYLADQTRTFSLGPVADVFAEAYEHARAILGAVAGEGRPGVVGARLYERACELAGDREGFMGGRGEQVVSFVGHGLGLEIDEPPFLARGWELPLEEGMVFALEPKFVRPGEGAVGVENTYAVTAGGVERLTQAPEHLIVL
jgi:Xaa-Pro dipeptidase